MSSKHGADRGYRRHSPTELGHGKGNGAAAGLSVDESRPLSGAPIKVDDRIRSTRTARPMSASAKFRHRAPDELVVLTPPARDGELIWARWAEIMFR